MAEILPAEFTGKLNITANEFRAGASDIERTARYNVLVMAVTSFEEYLKDTLERFLLKRWKLTKTYHVSFRPEELPAGADLLDFLRHRAVSQKAKDVINARYEERFLQIQNLLGEFGATLPFLPSRNSEFAIAAFESRNCIIHASGRVDARALQALTGIVSSLKHGDTLNLEEELLWKFLGALRDAARAIDKAVRTVKRAHPKQ